MGAVAAAMKQRGWDVTGSDEKPYPPLSDFLEAQGITVSLGYSQENLPKKEALIVIGNALSRGNPEVEAVLNRKLLYTSLPELLRTHFLQGRHNLVVTGTHGKTTTSSMLTWIFEYAQKKPSYLIGGIPVKSLPISPSCPQPSLPCVVLRTILSCSFFSSLHFVSRPS